MPKIRLPALKCISIVVLFILVILCAAPSSSFKNRVFSLTLVNKQITHVEKIASKVEGNNEL